MPHPLPPAPAAPADRADRSAVLVAPAAPAAAPPACIEVGELRGTVLRIVRVFVEAVVVPTTLLVVLLHVAGLVPALAAAVGWCLLALATRWALTRSVPGTLLLGAVVVLAKAAVALATSSALVYLLSPVLGSVFMAALFVGSALLGRPITLRVTRDFVHVPDHVLDRAGVRRMFAQVAVIWGASRALDAALTLVVLHDGVSTGLVAHSVISPVLTVSAVACCVAFGMRALRRHGVSVRVGPVAAGPVG